MCMIRGSATLTAEERALCDGVSEAVWALDKATEVLKEQLGGERMAKNPGYAAWLWLPADGDRGAQVVEGLDAFDRIRQHLVLFEYLDGMEINETVHLVGALGVNEDIFKTVLAVNACKRTLRAAVDRLNGDTQVKGRRRRRQIKVEVRVPKINSKGDSVGEKTRRFKMDLIAYHLRYTMIGQERINLIHAWREIPIAHRDGQALDSISFSQAYKARRLEALSVSQVRTRLERLNLADGPEHERRRAQLKLANDRRVMEAFAAQHPDEKLGWARNMAQQLRVNYTWIDQSGEQSTALDTAPLPVVYRLDSVSGQSRPQIIAPRPQAERRRRKDAITEATSMLASAEVYRYLPGYRKTGKKAEKRKQLVTL